MREVLAEPGSTLKERPGYRVGGGTPNHLTNMDNMDTFQFSATSVASQEHAS